jgi:hypothetical protein
MGLKSLPQKCPSEFDSKVRTTNIYIFVCVCVRACARVCEIVGKLKNHNFSLTKEKLESTAWTCALLDIQHFAQEVGMSVDYPRITTKLLKLWI